MARTVRVLFPGAIYHVTSRGNRREPIYRDDRDRRRQLAALADACDRYAVRVLAWCQMGNHCHWVVRTDEPTLPVFMRHLNGVYTQAFNRRHGLTGHVFQGRYHAVLVEREAHLVAVCRYVERNPVAAGLAGRAQDWRWSSCRAHLGRSDVPDWLDVGFVRSALLGRPPVSAEDVGRAIALYADGLDAPVTRGPADSIAAIVRAPTQIDAARRIARDETIVSLACAGEAPAELARRFGLSRTQVWRVLHRPGRGTDAPATGAARAPARPQALPAVGPSAIVSVRTDGVSSRPDPGGNA